MKRHRGSSNKFEIEVSTRFRVRLAALARQIQPSPFHGLMFNPDHAGESLDLFAGANDLLCLRLGLDLHKEFSGSEDVHAS